MTNKAHPVIPLIPALSYRLAEDSSPLTSLPMCQSSPPALYLLVQLKLRLSVLVSSQLSREGIPQQGLFHSL